MRRSSSLVVVAAARFDGKAYPYVFRGAAAASTINLTRVDDRTFKFIVLADGKASFAGTHALSADGKSVTQTFTANGKGEPSSAVLVYERPYGRQLASSL